MNNKILVAPSILAADFSKLEAEIQKAEKAGADWIHVDVMDGHFVPNITIGAPVVKSLRKISKIFLDCHLMIQQPEKYIEDFAKAGADLITFHLEAVKDPYALIEKIKSFKIKAGVSIKPKTDVKLLDGLFDKVDLILVMTVEPGFGGQAFIRDTLPKIKAIRQNFLGFLQVDGGITDITAKEAVLSGANVLVAGTYVFGSANMKNAIESLKV